MNIRESVSLKGFSTYGIGGPARYFCEVEGDDDLRKAVRFAKEKNIPLFFLMGGGSNLIIADEGINGLVIKLQTKNYKLQGTSVDAGAGITMADLVKKTAQAGLVGLEWAGGLPGTLGGAIFGNAGCFGYEIKDIIVSVRAAQIKNYEVSVKNYKVSDCGFSYRSSKFKREGNFVILSAILQFQKGNPEELMRLAKEKIDYRRSRHPLDYPNIGSIFKNIDEPELVEKILETFPELKKDIAEKWHGKVPTAVLIEKAGLAGREIGGAQISEKHANFIINKKEAKAADVVALIKEVKQKVKERFGIELEEEVRYVGFS